MTDTGLGFAWVHGEGWVSERELAAQFAGATRAFFDKRKHTRRQQLTHAPVTSAAAAAKHNNPRASVRL